MNISSGQGSIKLSMLVRYPGTQEETGRPPVRNVYAMCAEGSSLEELTDVARDLSWKSQELYCAGHYFIEAEWRMYTSVI